MFGDTTNAHGVDVPHVPELTRLDDLEATPHAEVFAERSPRTVRLSLEAGQSVPPHNHPGYDIVLSMIAGRLSLHLDDETYELEPGHVARFDGSREISPEAMDDSVALVVFAPTETAADGSGTGDEVA